ncbi:MAG: dynamin family protein [Selenomonadales bacterium]|nr:dynamin family protein [Selenomonadales bacterium]MDD7762928.1 dynamin family protein [Selenomonadales bacterium]
MNKNELQGLLQDAMEISKNNSVYDDSLAMQFSNIDKDIQQFVANVLVVGGFSAGKSAMLNTFLGNTEILPENISPETAIATEIQFGTTEKVIRVKDNGDTAISSLSEVRDVSVAGYMKYVYVLDRPQLQDLKDLVLVDMPGFDSGIEAHNRALLQYIDKAAAYIFVIDMNRGTVGEKSLDFLSEIREYSDCVHFVLTKSDKVAPANIDNIREEIGNVLKSVLGKKPEFTLMSIREDGARDKLCALFNKISADDLLMQKYGGNVLFLLHQVIARMKSQVEALEFNPKDIDLAIMQQENHKNAVLNKIKQEEKRLRDDMRLNVPERIIKDVETAFTSQISLLVSSAVQGNDSFRATINNILRPVLLQSTERHIEASLDDYMLSIENFVNENSLNAADVTDKLQKTIDTVKVIAETGKMFAKAQEYGKLYKFFSTGLAVTTNIVAPWMELIIIFLPDILSAINRIMGKSREEELQEHIQNVVIPQICSKLRPNIQKALMELEAEQMEAMESKFQAMLNNEIRALEQLKEEKKTYHIEVENKKEQLLRGVEKLNTLVVRIEKDMTMEAV